jgi:hypothetical protein
MDPIKELRKRLDRAGHPAPLKCLWEDVEVGQGSAIACYVANGRLFIVQTWEVGGWDIYIPASNSNSVGDTMKALVEYLTNP